MFPDLTRSITFRSTELNSVASAINASGQTYLAGCKVTQFDISDVELRQFTEGLALTDGIDVGGVWKGARRFVMRGFVADATRGQTYARLATLEGIFLPASGEFGFYDLVWRTISGATPTVTTKTASVRPNGLRALIQDDMHSGGVNASGTIVDSQPLAIQWAVSFFAKNPAIT